MQTLTFAAANENLARTMNSVCKNNEPIMITREPEKPVVMLSLDDYNSLEETAHLLRSPANAERLAKSIAQLEQGRGITKTFSELGISE